MKRLARKAVQLALTMMNLRIFSIIMYTRSDFHGICIYFLQLVWCLVLNVDEFSKLMF